MSAEELKAVVCQKINEKSTELNEISQKIWKNPELKLEERFAHELLTTYLEKEGFSVRKSTPLETSFIARYGNSKGLKIGICCEYDALPGIGHACGHNLIAEAGVGAALGLKAVLEDGRVEQPFEVIVYGTPAEEGYGGKVEMIKQGVFDELDVCMMSHPTPLEISTPYWLARSQLSIVYSGKPAHAAAAPWEGINALDAAVACYNNISMLRQQMKPTSRIHCTIVDGGKQPNIIPERSELLFYVRALDDNDVDELNKKVMGCANGAAVATGCEVEITENAPRYSNVLTNDTMVQLYVANAKSLGVEFNDDEYTKKLQASTDMGNVSQIKPSIHPLYKIQAEGPNHTHEFTEATGSAESQLPTLKSAKSMAMTAVDIVMDKEVMKSMREEFVRNTKKD